MSLTKRIKELENKVLELENLLKRTTESLSSKEPSPYSKIGSTFKKEEISPIDFGQWSSVKGGGIIWNDAIRNKPSLTVKPETATIGYNCHGHGRYSGGALDINTLEIVEYDVNWNTETQYNKDCQDWWKFPDNRTVLGFTPKIKKADKIFYTAIIDTETGETTVTKKSEQVDKLGKIDFIFNPYTSKWGTSSFEIDVEQCYFVKRRTTKQINKDELGNEIEGADIGEIELDSKGNQMKSPLYNAIDNTKSSIVWDANSQCWRFYCTFFD